MLKFIYTKPYSDKTAHITAKAVELSRSGKDSVIIVPEQFTFETEKRLIQNKANGPAVMLNTTVLSFNRLFDEVGRHSGGISGELLSDAQKIIFMHRALNRLSGKLLVWNNYVKSISFAKSMLDTIGEFKINAISVEDLREKTEAITSPLLKNKLLDIAAIYEEYDNFLKEKFLDPADKLTKLSLNLEKYHYFDGKSVFIDSFKDFTGQQFKILGQILEQAEDVYIYLTYNPAKDREYGLFSNVGKNIVKIRELAHNRKVPILSDEMLEDSEFENEDLINLEKLISGEKIETSTNESVFVNSFSSVYDEAEFTAYKIRNLVATKNYRYNDFVIVARDADSYTEAVVSACKKNDVPLFYDNRLPLNSFPISVAVDSLFNALSLSTESILRFHKTGLSTLTFDEITKLENYLYIWKIDREDWLKEWDMNPAGFRQGKLNKSQLEELKVLNQLRIKAIEPILSFKKNAGDSAYSIAKAVFSVCDNPLFKSALSTLRQRLNDQSIISSDNLLEQSYEAYIEVLDSIVTCFSKNTVSVSEFYEALTLAVSLSTVGVIPQHLDEVTFGSADRIRTSQPKIVFVLGANLGVFPPVVSSKGILSVRERKELIDAKLTISDNAVALAIDEEFLVYSNLCCATDMVFISYSQQSVSGEKLEPASFIENISKSFKIPHEKVKNCDFIHNPQTEKAAFSSYCKLQNTNEALADLIKSALEKTEFNGKISSIDTAFDNNGKIIEKETAAALYGDKLTISPTTLDTFSHCPFSFFCQFGLNVKTAEAVEFNVMQKGLIVHYVLERFVTENKGNFKTLSYNDCDLLTEQYFNEYINSLHGYRTVEDILDKFILQRLLRSAKEVVRHVKSELSQSEFSPFACEVKIGTKYDQIKATLHLENGADISLKGSIDRVDICDDYIRIIDYKTGSKTFNLNDILYGINLQMLVYLYALIRGENSPIKDLKPAAILYQPSSRSIDDKGLAMNGLVTDDVSVVRKMENDMGGIFIPKAQLTKSGTISGVYKSFVNSEVFEQIFDIIEKLIKRAGERILNGDIRVLPIDGKESDACKYCDFSAVCNYMETKHHKVPTLAKAELFEKIKEGEICEV